jgi:hypothetical protein
MNELERIRALLPTELYADSKDWREGSLVERVEWLLFMYQNSHEDVLRLEQDVDDLKQGRYYAGPETYDNC